jgi:hypothetical protein
VVINNKINQTAIGAELGARTGGHSGFPPSVKPPCPSLSAERWPATKMAKSKRMETIYVRLLDEAVDVWRPVTAEALGGERYRIISDNTDPEDEKWEFQTGDVVHCVEKELMDGTKSISRLVAVSKGSSLGQKGAGADRG